MYLRLLWIKEGYVSYSKVTNFDVAIVWVYVNGLAGKLSMHQVDVVKELKTLENLEAPLLYNY